MKSAKRKNKREPSRVAVIGVGMVGRQVARYFKEKRKYVRGRNLFLFDTDSRKGLDDDPNKADVIFVAVPSPNYADGSANISYVENSLRRLKPGKIAVIKSTVPPGTTEYFQKKYPLLKLLFNPEFLTEKQAWNNFVNPDRQIVGFTKKSRPLARGILNLLPSAPFRSPAKQYNLTATEAELVKYAGNVYLARRIVFANAIADITKKLNADYENVRQGLAADKRIGQSHLDINHGGYRGFGGYCFPKDMKALIAYCKQLKLHRCADLLAADWKFNKELLNEQGIAIEDVWVHDHEWLRNKIQNP